MQNLLSFPRVMSPASNPIGVDFGTDCLRLAQVRPDEDDFALHASASVEIPPDVRNDAELRLTFFAQTIGHLLSQGPFRGKQAILGIPSSVLHIQQLSLRPMEDAELKEAALQEARRQFPFDPAHALVRCVVAGQFQRSASLLQDRTALRVIVMAADVRWIRRYLAAAKSARLNVVAMNALPTALLDCFAQVCRRAADGRAREGCGRDERARDAQATRCYIDIGGSGTRAMVARGTRLMYARNIDVGGDHLTRAVAETIGIAFQDARTLRIKLGAGPAANAEQVESAIHHNTELLIAQLNDCRKEHESAFPEFPIEQLIFVGGEARQDGLCQRIARQMGLPGQSADSLCPMASDGEEIAGDRREPQSAWAAAIGLSMGQAAGGPANDEYQPADALSR